MGIKELYKKKDEIVNGHINELRSKMGLTNKVEELIFSIRKKICEKCPLKVNNTCNPKMWINPETLEVSNTSKENYVKGCGCRLNAKQKSKTSKCPANFWGGEFDKQ